MTSTQNRYGVYHLIAQKSGDLVELLQYKLDLDPHEIIELIHLGSVYKNHKRIKPAESFEQVQELDYFRVHTEPRRYVTKHHWEKHIIYQNDDFILLDKPSGLPSHPCVDNKTENVLVCLEQFLKIPLYITHRLDIPTSGLIILAKNKEFQSSFNQTLSQSGVKKIYLAHISGKYSGPKYLEHFMLPTPTAPKKFVDRYQEGALICQLQILKSTPTEDGSELEIELITGRTQQIRAQLSHIGYPIIGDTLYGGKAIRQQNQIQLRSVALSFSHQNQYYSWDLRK